MSNSKPPVGVEPAWLCASRRISELAKAIARYADDEHGAARRFLIRVWADEIKMQLDIWDKITTLEEMVLEETEGRCDENAYYDLAADVLRGCDDVRY